MADKITIFKEVFDYYYDGEITKEQLADLLLMHYETRWGDGVDVKEIEDKDLRMIWRTLQHSVIKSTKNAKQYEKQQNKKSVLQEVTTTEFDIPNCQISNTSDLSASKPSEDNLYHQEVESGSNGLKIGKEEEIGINANIDNKMGTLTNIIQKEDGTFEKIDLPRENEMLETLLSDEEIIEKVVKEFIETEGDGGYNMFIKLNSTDPKSDEFRVLWNKWCHKWNRYNTTEERVRLIGNISERVCKIYFNRYKEVA